MNIKIDLSTSGIQQLQKQLNDYAKNTLPQQAKLFIEKLAELGIKVGMQNTGEYKDYIVFSLENLSVSNKGCKGILVAKDLQQITKEWNVKEGTHDETISPILMAEFGSGWLFDSAWNVPVNGASQGALNKYGHALDPNGWYWVDMDERLHHSIGELPTYPVYKAYVEMKNNINKIAKEVFGNG